MHITGERRIPAPRERVWRCLTDRRVLQDCASGSHIEPDGDGLILSSAGVGSVRAQPSIREPFTTLGWRIDPGGAATQMVLVRLTEQGVFTLLGYELSLADPDGIDSPTRTANLRARIDQALERLVHTVAGTGEIGAGGIAGAVQAATDPSAQPNASLHAAASGPGMAEAAARLMNPTVIGGVLFLIVLLFMVGLL